MTGKRKSKKSKATKKAFNLQQWLLHKLRRISYQFPERKEVLANARVSRGKYTCAICKGSNFGPKEIQLDHILPVISPHDGFVDWNTYIERLFCSADGWQVCCRVCHGYKTTQENSIRSQTKKDKK